MLLLSWEDDNLGVEKEILRLEHVFSNFYRFNVAQFKISRDEPGRATLSQVFPFSRGAGKAGSSLSIMLAMPV